MNPTTEVRIFRSSAGSGKTWRLVFEYLRIILPDPPAFRKILAITFTNKAAREMKERILGALGQLRDGKDEKLMQQLFEAIRLTPAEIRRQSGYALSLILHDYGNFSVSTIDSFTYRIVRTFSRDLGLPESFNVEMDTESLVVEITDNLLDRIGRDPWVTDILSEFTREKMEGDSGWNIDREIRSIGMLLFREDSMKRIARLQELGEEGFVRLIASMKKGRRDFLAGIKSLSERAREIMDAHGITEGDFSHGGGGAGAMFRKAGDSVTSDQFAGLFRLERVRKALDQDEWTAKSAANKAKAEAALDAGLREVAHELDRFVAVGLERYATFEAAMRNIHALAVVRQLGELLEQWKADENAIHISDFNRKISEFLGDESPDFLYWRLGERYRHFMIDEFQDTSRLQWDNLWPLFENLMAGSDEPGSLLLVGDSKQAIYRFRGGRVELLEEDAPRLLGTDPIILDRNFRSAEMVVEFNNRFFQSATSVLSAHVQLQRIYRDVSQFFKDEMKGKGYVQAVKLEGKKEEFNNASLSQLLAEIQECRNAKYHYRDMAVLVRKVDEGALTAKFLFENGIPVISSDSLLLVSSPEVNFIVSALGYLSDPGLEMRRAELLHHHFLRHHDAETAAVKVREFPKGVQAAETEPLSLLTQEIASLPVYEMCEEIIRRFGLNDAPGAWVQHFLEEVYRFSDRGQTDIFSFMEHWEEKKDTLSLSVPEGEDAIRILTIHKCKGLQFPVTFIPFLNWKLGSMPNSYLWATASTKPDGVTEDFLVNNVKGLDRTEFAADRQAEMLQTVLENLNVMYVAFTRAEMRSYIHYIASASIGTEPETAGDLFQLATDTAPLAEFPSVRTENRMQWGTEAEGPKKEKKPAGEKASALISRNWKSSLQVSTLSQRVQPDNPQNRLDNLLREFLLSVRDEAGLQKEMTTRVETGMVTGEEANRLGQAWRELRDHPELKEGYAGGRMRLSPDLLLPGRYPLTADLAWEQGGRRHVVFVSATEAEKERKQKLAGMWKQEDPQSSVVHLQLLAGVAAVVPDAATR